MSLSAIAADVRAWLGRQQIAAPGAWVEACLEFVRDEFEVARWSNWDAGRWQKAVFDQWLFADLRELDTAVLPADLSSRAKSTFHQSVCVQLLHAVDVSQPVYAQLRATEGTENENSQVSAEAEEVRAAAGPARGATLLLHLSDGVVEARGLVRQPIPNLDLRPGTKLRLRGPIPVRRGVLLLGPDSVQPLGGEVDALVEQNRPVDVLRRLLHANTGQQLRERAQRPPPGQPGPPVAMETSSRLQPTSVVSTETTWWPSAAETELTRPVTMETSRPHSAVAMETSRQPQSTVAMELFRQPQSTVAMGTSRQPHSAVAMEISRPHSAVAMETSRPHSAVAMETSRSRSTVAMGTSRPHSAVATAPTRSLFSTASSAISLESTRPSESPTIAAEKTWWPPSAGEKKGVTSSRPAPPLLSVAPRCPRPDADDFGGKARRMESDRSMHRKEILKQLFDDDDEEEEEDRPTSSLTIPVKREPLPAPVKKEEEEFGDEALFSAAVAAVDEAEPFSYILDVYQRLAAPGFSGRLRVAVKGFVMSLLGRLEYHDGERWSLKVRLGDGTASVDCLLTDAVIAGPHMIGRTAAELAAVKRRVRQGGAEAEAAKAELVAHMQRLQRNVARLNGLFDMEVDEKWDQPMIVGYREVDEVTVAALKSRLLNRDWKTEMKNS